MVAALVLSTITACATDNDESMTISADKLPEGAKLFLSQHFPGDKVSFASENRDATGVNYYALLASGCKLEFDDRGEWEEISNRKGSVPDEVVPAAVMAYVQTNYSGERIIEIERDYHRLTGAYSYDIELAGGVEIGFDELGEWEEVSNHNSPVPDAIVPAQIKSYVSTNYAGAFILKIERNVHRTSGTVTYEVELSNRVEIDFDAAFNAVRVELD